MFHSLCHQGSANENHQILHAPIRKAQIQNSDNTKCWQRCGETGMCILCWQNENGTALWKQVWWFLPHVNALLLYESAIMLLGIHPADLETYIRIKYLHIDTYSHCTCKFQDFQRTKISLRK